MQVFGFVREGKGRGVDDTGGHAASRCFEGLGIARVVRSALDVGCGCVLVSSSCACALRLVRVCSRNGSHASLSTATSAPFRRPQEQLDSLEVVAPWLILTPPPPLPLTALWLTAVGVTTVVSPFITLHHSAATSVNPFDHLR